MTPILTSLLDLPLLATIQPLLAAYQSRADEEAAAAVAGFFGIVMLASCATLLFFLALAIFNCFYLMSILKRIPPEHRKQEPAMVWLLLIPLFGIIWSFFVYPRVADSFKSYFTSIGRTDVGDCGSGLALALCITICTIIIPYIGWACASFVALIIWAILMFKFANLKRQLPA